MYDLMFVCPCLSAFIFGLSSPDLFFMMLYFLHFSVCYKCWPWFLCQVICPPSPVFLMFLITVVENCTSVDTVSLS